MSSSSRALASNYVNSKIYFKTIYNSMDCNKNSNVCIVCSNKSNSIRMDTCCFDCFEKKLVSIKMSKKRKTGSFLGNLCKFMK